MIKHPELEVPSWAGAMVANYRRALSLPAVVTDAAIFYALKELSGYEEADILEDLKERFQ